MYAVNYVHDRGGDIANATAMSAGAQLVGTLTAPLFGALTDLVGVNKVSTSGDPRVVQPPPPWSSARACAWRGSESTWGRWCPTGGDGRDGAVPPGGHSVVRDP